MTRHWAPLCAACAPTFASSVGTLPYTNCQAQTFSPRCFRPPTTSGENCDQYVAPSPDLMKTVLTPFALARAAMASRSPPSDLSRYQIHIPFPSKTVPVGVSLGAAAGGGGLTTWIGP